MKAAESIDTPVLVVGGGPVGLVAAYTLAHHGVRCMLVERNESTTQWPKMDITNVRSMEILQRLGLADSLREQGVAQHYSLDTIISSGLGKKGETITRIDLPSPNEFREMIREQNDGSMPREPYQRCSQAIFEAWLRKIVEAHPLIDSHWNTQLKDIEEEPEMVISTLVSGTESRTIQTQYVVGCDGAGSRVRRTMGIALTGSPMQLKMFLVHFKSKDLARIRAQGQFWHLMFTSGGIVIAQDEVDTWTTHLPVPLDFDVSKLDPQRVIYRVLGGHTGEYRINIDEILVSSTWTPATNVADHYRTSGGRVFLAGDSAHQNIPTGGYGMNTGLGDAFDVGWKLATVLNGYGGPNLLDSYESERRPVALHNVHRAALHRDNHQRYVEMVIKAGPETILSLGPDGQDLKSRIKSHIDANDGVNKERGTEMDYRVRLSPVVIAEKESVEPEYNHRQYTPSTLPGSRAPHVFLKDGQTSIFDLYGPGYTIVDFSPDGLLSMQLVQVAEAKGIPLTRIHLPQEDTVRRIWERDVVLVRPDGYVAWRSTGSQEKYSESYIESVLLVAVGQRLSGT